MRLSKIKFNTALIINETMNKKLIYICIS